MHVRFSTCIGVPVLAEDSEEYLGKIDGIVVHPDSGKIEGFYVSVQRFLHTEELFLSSMDIARFGMRVIIRSRDVLAPTAEFIRIGTLISGSRPVLGQKIRTESGKSLGKCRDVQFDTRVMSLTWLFPKRWGHWGTPISVREIMEVLPEAIVVRDSAAPAAVTVAQNAETPLVPLVPEVPEGA